jgi:hypothetical protein
MAHQDLAAMLAQPVTVGWWYAECCLDGLLQLTTPAEVEALRADLEQDYQAEQDGRWHGSLIVGVWPTEAAARTALAERPCDTR